MRKNILKEKDICLKKIQKREKELQNLKIKKKEKVIDISRN